MPHRKKPTSMQLKKISIRLWHWKAELWHLRRHVLKSSTLKGFLFISACTQFELRTKLFFNWNSCRKCRWNSLLLKKNTFLMRKEELPCVADNFENVNDESRKSCPFKHSYAEYKNNLFLVYLGCLDYEMETHSYYRVFFTELK